MHHSLYGCKKLVPSSTLPLRTPPLSLSFPFAYSCWTDEHNNQLSTENAAVFVRVCFPPTFSYLHLLPPPPPSPLFLLPAGFLLIPPRTPFPVPAHPYQNTSAFIALFVAVAFEMDRTYVSIFLLPSFVFLCCSGCPTSAKALFTPPPLSCLPLPPPIRRPFFAALAAKSKKTQNLNNNKAFFIDHYATLFVLFSLSLSPPWLPTCLHPHTFPRKKNPQAHTHLGHTQVDRWWRGGEEGERTPLPSPPPSLPSCHLPSLLTPLSRGGPLPNKGKRGGG